MSKCNRLQKPVRKKPTLGDVAKAAGVSTATVSRALNAPQTVGDKVRAKVEQQIRLLGYVRDGAARALASSNSRTIGAIIPTLESAIFASGINAVEQRLDEAGYSLRLAVSNYDQEHELKQIREMMEQGVDGILLIGNDHLPEAFNLMKQHQQLFANMWAYSEDAPYPCIGFDNRQASRQVAEYLLELGHRRLSIISGISKNNDRAKLRIQGAKDAFQAYGLSINDDDIIERNYDIWEGRHATRFLMNRPHHERPTAIICGNDVLALGCLLECRHSGIRVPEDVSITGFDDLPLSEHLLPGLTTVHIPTTQMGHQAANFLLDSLADKSPETKKKLPTQLVIRGSTAPPAAD
ncbi:LacI family DNA-binding transcriptional regulator [Amphritea sp. 1_MG-2023]|uniref:LacI family DNA-binding transcriptional regulator n=1 Tax=Amphritea sp. 1_MG-2023 TaxID=3062670 RepID=UPI0026E45621|nr:LacI family DNA-binding transcriptional regulator [Amphritea sp. 1_MG-2023]MDO6565162.1 LacI family DNA-binding transcriptional regulator [Amphritea sp. 1_MG-2023]